MRRRTTPRSPGAALAAGALSEPSRAGAAPRSQLQLLRDPVVGPFFAGKFLATVGMWINSIAAAIVVYDLTGSASLVGAVSVSQFGPQFIITPYSGARADRGNRRRQLMLGRLLVALGAALTVVWHLLVGLEGTVGAGVIIGASLVVGVGGSLGSPAMHALIPAMVRLGELPSAMALNAIPFTAARAGGPAVGALLVSAGGPIAAFAIAAACNIVFAVVLAFLRIRDEPPPTSGDTSVLGGLRFLRQDPVLMGLLVGAATIGFGSDPVITLSPPLAAELGGSSVLAGTLASSFGVGAAIIYPFLGWLRRRFGLPHVSAGGLLTIALGTLALAVAPNVPLAALSFAIAGAGMTLAVTGIATEIQQRAPDELRGRIMALWSVAFLGSRPIAAAMNGTVADAAGVPAALFLVTAVVLVGWWRTRPAARSGS